MSCQAVRRQIEETELDQYPRARDLSAHLSACRACREFEAEQRALRQLVGSLGAVQAPADFDFRLRARLAASGGPTRRHLLFGFLPAPGAQAIALAALFAVLVAGAAIFKHAQQGFAGDAFEPQANAAPRHEAKPSPNEQQQLASTRESEELKDNMLASRDAGERERGRISMSVRRRVRADVKSGEERGVGPTAAAAASLAAGPKRDSLEFSSKPASVISLFEMQVPEANQPMKVSLEDRRGKTRTLSVQRVTFGSQEIIEQPGAQPAPRSSSKGIW